MNQDVISIPIMRRAGKTFKYECVWIWTPTTYGFKFDHRVGNTLQMIPEIILLACLGKVRQV